MWCCVVWCGVVYCSVEWCGVVRCVALTGIFLRLFFNLYCLYLLDRYFSYHVPDLLLSLLLLHSSIALISLSISPIPIFIFSSRRKYSSLVVRVNSTSYDINKQTNQENVR